LIFVPIFVMILAAMRWGARRSPSPTGQEVIEKLQNYEQKSAKEETYSVRG